MVYEWLPVFQDFGSNSLGDAANHRTLTLMVDPAHGQNPDALPKELLLVLECVWSTELGSQVSQSIPSVGPPVRV